MKLECIENLSWETIGNIYRNLGVDIDNDEEVEKANKVLATLTPVQLLSKWLAWNGIHGYSYDIYNVCKELIKIEEFEEDNKGS